MTPSGANCVTNACERPRSGTSSATTNEGGIKTAFRENGTAVLFVDSSTASFDGADQGENEMPGIQVFKTLADALRAGYHVYDRTTDGYLVRTRTTSGWAMALVICH
jgi:hypothetical protein